MTKIKAFFKKIGITAYTVKKAARTFLQTAIAYCATMIGDYAIYGYDAENQNGVIIGLIISAISAGVAAVMNLDFEDYQEVEEETADETAEETTDETETTTDDETAGG